MRTRELRERRGQIAAQMAALANNLTAEHREQFDAMDREQDDLRQQIERLERAEALEAETRSSGAPPAGQPNNGQQERSADEAAAYSQAYMNYLKYGERQSMRGAHLIRGISEQDRQMLYRGARNVVLDSAQRQNISEELRSLGAAPGLELRDMGTGGGGAYPGATTGFFVPVGFMNRIEMALKYFGPMLSGDGSGNDGMPTIMPTATGQPLPFPTDNDTTTTGELIGEGVQVSAGDVNISQIVLGAYKFSTKLIKVSIELLQDSAFDLESYLVSKFSLRLGRILNTKMTVGTGTNEPKGIIPAATVGLSGTTTPAVVGDDNAASPDPTQQVGYTDFINLEHSADPLYRPGAKYMMHDTTLRFVKTLKDKYGRPLWVQAMTANAPDTINGYPFAINNDMATLAANAKTVAFGQLNKYTIRRVKEMSVLRLEERFADYGQVAFLAFARYDGTLLDAGTHPVVLLQQHA